MAHVVTVHHHHRHQQHHKLNDDADGEGPAWGTGRGENTFKQEDATRITIPDKARKFVEKVRVRANLAIRVVVCCCT